jgi:hypothetical protein
MFYLQPVIQSSEYCIKYVEIAFLFDTVRIWEFSPVPVWTDFDKCHNLSKRNVKLILKILSDLEHLRGSSNKKKRCIQLVRVCAFFGTSKGPRVPKKAQFTHKLIQ